MSAQIKQDVLLDLTINALCLYQAVGEIRARSGLVTFYGSAANKHELTLP